MVTWASSIETISFSFLDTSTSFNKYFLGFKCGVQSLGLVISKWLAKSVALPPLSHSLPSPPYLVETVEMQRLSTDMQEQGQELGAGGGGTQEVPRGGQDH